jgi:hypothetical protein
MEAPPTSHQAYAGSSRILGGGKHPFPFAQNTYSRRSQRHVKPRVLGDQDKKSKTTKKLVEPVQPKDHPPKVIPPSSSSFEEYVSQYKILI